MTQNRLCLSTILIALASACATTPEEPKPVPAPAPQAAPAPAPKPAPAPVAVAPAKPVAPAKATAPSARSIYFDYDEYVIKPEFKSVLEAHAKYLWENPSVQGRIEGNADERGSREYNLALGQRRAEAVVRSLVILGVPANRLEAISWGEEKPRASGHDETSWSQNRRGDFVYKD